MTKKQLRILWKVVGIMVVVSMVISLIIPIFAWLASL